MHVFKGSYAVANAYIGVLLWVVDSLTCQSHSGLCNLLLTVLDIEPTKQAN